MSDVSEARQSSRFWTVLLLGMLLRVIWAILIPVEPVSDSAAYDTFARTLWLHGVYGWTPEQPGAYWAVGTSAIAAATYFVLGDSYLGIVVLNLVAALLTMCLIYRLGEIYFDARAGFWAMAIIAFWPNLIFFSSVLSSELYFIALTVAGLYFWARPDGNRWVNLIVCGLIWGLACYMRPVILLLPAALVIAEFPGGWKATFGAALRGAATIGLILLVVSPWTMRNAEVIGKPYLVSSNFGTNLWMGNNPDSNGGYMPLPQAVEGMGEVAREETLSAMAKAYIREDWGRFAGNVFKRVLLLHNRETIGVAWNKDAIRRWSGDTGLLAAKLLATGYWYLLIIAALAGVAVFFTQRRLGALFHPVFGGWAYFTAVHAVIVAEDRYHMPSSPFIALLAGLALAQIAGKLKGASDPVMQRPAA